MKILIYSDLHFRQGKPIGKRFTHHNHQLIETCKWIGSLVKQYDIDLLVFCGDLFHTASKITAEEIEATHEGLYRIYEHMPHSGKNHIMITGNHDIYSEEFTALSMFSEFDSEISVVRNNFVYDFDGLYFAGWGYDITQLKGGKALFCHAEFKGAKFNNYAVCDHGIKPSDMRGRFNKIFCGHYHNRGKIGDIKFVGSPVCQTFADSDSFNRGVCIYDTESDKCKNFINPYTDLFMQITIPDDPCFNLYHVVKKVPHKERTNLRIHASYAEDVDQMCKITEGFKSVTIVRFEVDQEKYEIGEIEVIENVEELDVIGGYIKSVDTKKLDKEHLIRIGRDLLLN